MKKKPGQKTFYQKHFCCTLKGRDCICCSQVISSYSLLVVSAVLFVQDEGLVSSLSSIDRFKNEKSQFYISWQTLTSFYCNLCKINSEYLHFCKEMNFWTLWKMINSIYQKLQIKQVCFTK